MAVELYLKAGFGRRIRRVSSTAGLRHILGSLWTSMTAYGAAGAPSAVVTGVPVTGNGTGAAATINLNFHQHPAPANATITVAGTYDGTPFTFTQAITAGQTANQVASALAANAGWPAGLTAGAAGATVTAEPANSLVLSALTVTIA